jgi:hypothetical protein
MKRAANIQSLYAEQEQELAAPTKRIMQPDSGPSAPVHSIHKLCVCEREKFIDNRIDD